MRILIGIVLVSFLGCGSMPLKPVTPVCPDVVRFVNGPYVQNPRKGKVVEEVFKPYVKTFESVTNVKVVDIPITFEKQQEDTVIGVCWVFGFINLEWREIRIDPEYWDRATEDEKESLILHELGHCALSRDHTEEKMALGAYPKVPKSIMYPFNIGSHRYYRDLREHYHTELGENK